MARGHATHPSVLFSHHKGRAEWWTRRATHEAGGVCPWPLEQACGALGEASTRAKPKAGPGRRGLSSALVCVLDRGRGPPAPSHGLTHRPVPKGPQASTRPTCPAARGLAAGSRVALVPDLACLTLPEAPDGSLGLSQHPSPLFCITGQSVCWRKWSHGGSPGVESGTGSAGPGQQGAPRPRGWFCENLQGLFPGSGEGRYCKARVLGAFLSFELLLRSLSESCPPATCRQNLCWAGPETRGGRSCLPWPRVWFGPAPSALAHLWGGLHSLQSSRGPWPVMRSAHSSKQAFFFNLIS